MKDPPDHWLVTIIDLEFLTRHGTRALGGESAAISSLVGMGMMAAAWLALEKAVAGGRGPAAFAAIGEARRPDLSAAATIRRVTWGPSDE